MIRIAIPKGSLEKGTFDLFEQADLPIKRRDERDYNLKIDDPRVSEALMLRPQEIAKYIQEDEFDLGITGLDWIMETESSVREVADLGFSRGGWNNVKIVLATHKENPINRLEDISASAKIVTEYPRITRRFFKRLGKGKVRIRLSYGATEVKVPRLADYLVDVTESGETLKKNNKKILATILESSTKLIANIKAFDDPKKKKEIEEIASLLLGAIRAREKVLIKMNIVQDDVAKLVDLLPSLRAPTISPLATTEEEDKWVMVETVVEKRVLNILLPKIKEIGGKDILELKVSKIVP
ncbi:MAG: ATP phosphoribosyltransferase [bacterium]